MLQTAVSSRFRWLSKEDIDNFPYEDLRTINRLWLHYSKGKFGFSVQKEIFESLGGMTQYRLGSRGFVEKFGVRVGWRRRRKWLNYSELTFDYLRASPGHLPALWCGSWSAGVVGWLSHGGLDDAVVWLLGASVLVIFIFLWSDGFVVSLLVASVWLFGCVFLSWAFEAVKTVEERRRLALSSLAERLETLEI